MLGFSATKRKLKRGRKFFAHTSRQGYSVEKKATSDQGSLENCGQSGGEGLRVDEGWEFERSKV